MAAEPLVVLCLLTYERTDLAVRTVKAIEARLAYGGRFGWYVADDGSSEAHHDAVIAAVGDRLLGQHNERLGPGPSWNRAIANAAALSPFIGWCEDDWELRRELNITPYVELLLERPDVGMVRLGHLPVGLDCRSVGYAGRHYLDIQPSTPYRWSGNPSVLHYRHFAAYGGFPTDNRTPGECEVYHDHFVRERQGPMVWWPVDLGGWGIFGHTGTEKSY